MIFALLRFFENGQYAADQIYCVFLSPSSKSARNTEFSKKQYVFRNSNSNTSLLLQRTIAEKKIRHLKNFKNLLGPQNENVGFLHFQRKNSLFGLSSYLA